MISFANRSVAATAAAFVTAITLVAATPVRAETVSKTVAYADLDIQGDAGRAALDRRIRNAAVAVCGPRERALNPRVAACIRNAVAGARAQVANQQGRVAIASR